MKRLIPMLLVVLVLLSACNRKESTEKTEEIEPTTVALYDPSHPVEQQTAGAVRGYPLQENHFLDLIPMGDKLLLLTETNQLIALRGEICEQVASVEIDAVDRESISVSPLGIGFIQKSSEEAVILNPFLQESARISVADDRESTPIISLKNHEVYYCQGQEIRALNLSTGISRLVRSQLDSEQRLVGSWFDGDVLLLEGTDHEGNAVKAYVESKTGKTVSADEGVYEMASYGDAYFAFRLDGKVSQKVFGSRTETPHHFLPEETVYPVLPMKGAVTASADESGLSLKYYDLEAGKHTASVMIAGVKEPVTVTANEKFVWILAEDANTGKQTIFRWDVSKSQVQDGETYVGPLYTAQNPDTEGLAECQKRAKEIGNQYGVKISIAEDAAMQAGDMVIQQEHQVPIIHAMLDELEKALARFPEGFLKNTIRGGSVRIGLVRRIPEEQTYSQFYKDGDAWVLLTTDSDISDDFIRGIAYVVDSHVLGNSRDYDTWDKLNPSGFQYDYDYGKNDQRQDLSYLEGEQRAFVDQRSMSYPHEDRAAIFCMAMSEEGQEIFDSPVLQKKLLRMCEGIREAYGLEKKADTYPWEQYLEKSIAYVKK